MHTPARTGPENIRADGHRWMLFRQIGGTAVVTFGSLALATANAIVVARLLGAAGRGIVTAVFLFPAVAPAVSLMSISTGVIYYTGTDPDRRARYQGTALLIGMVVSFLAVAVAAAFRMELWGVVLRDVPFMPSISIAITSAILLSVLGGTLQSVVLSDRRVATYNMGALCLVGAKFVALPVAFLLPAQIRLHWVVWVEVAGMALSAAVLMSAVHLPMSWQAADWVSARKILVFSLREHIGNVLQKGNYVLDQFVIALFLFKADLGLYSLAVMLAQLIWVIPNAAAPALLPHITGARTADEEETTYLVARVVLWTSGFAALSIAVVSPFVPAIFGKEFKGAILPLLVLLPGVLSNAYSKVLARIVTGKGFPGADSAAAAVSFGVTVVLLSLLLPRYGILGAAIATTASYVAYLLYLIGYARSRLHLPLGSRMIYDRDDFRRVVSAVAANPLRTRRAQ